MDCQCFLLSVSNIEDDRYDISRDKLGAPLRSILLIKLRYGCIADVRHKSVATLNTDHRSANCALLNILQMFYERRFCQ